MRFRTEIEPVATSLDISHDTPLLLLGSCFSDEIGTRLDTDGFRTVHNPLGPLFNPCSITRCLRLAKGIEEPFVEVGPRGFHAIDFASRYSGSDKAAILGDISAGLGRISDILSARPVAILTLGSAFVYRHNASGRIVGNCHKFPASAFTRERLGTEEICRQLRDAIGILLDSGCRHVLLTISPIRHLDDGLHGNTLSKAALHLGAEEALRNFGSDTAGYFPSYEILMDDLRDYRFYAPDMKHPSETAADYIYEIFSKTYFSKATQATALESRRLNKTALHRPIL